MARVLVVDDDPDILALVTTQLRQAGHRVNGVGSASEALELISAKGAPDVAVLDVDMPEMNGMELLQAIRSQHEPAMAAVFLSAKVRPEDIDAGKALGATYLTKPYVKSALLNAIEKALPAGPEGGAW